MRSSPRSAATSRSSRSELTLTPESRLLTPFTFHLIPHTHWDREWYATRAAFQARLVPVLDGVLAQLEADAAARFVLDGQTVLLEDYLAVKPEQEPRIAAQVRRGALEIGPWYVLSDLLIPSAASLRRNLEEGTRDAARFGRRLNVLYSPDAFGHPAGLPGLAAEFGLRWAVVRRGLGRPCGIDRDLYRWEAADAGVLLYHLPAGGYDLAIGLAEPGADPARRWAAIRRELVGRAVTSQIAVFLGADHHAMAPDLSGLRQRIQALEPAHRVRVSGLTEFFEAVEAARPDPPVVRGELRRGDGHVWLLQGVHSTRSRLKRRHGAAEHALARLAEPLARRAAPGGGGGGDRNDALRFAWRTLLQSQFHDTLAGTTCDPVQQEQAVRLDAVAAWSREVAARSLDALLGHDPDRARPPERTPSRLVLWNPAEQPRAAIATAELSFFRREVLVGAPDRRKPRLGTGFRPFALLDPSGRLLPTQLLAVTRAQERRDTPRRYPVQAEIDRVRVAFEAPAVAGLATLVLLPKPARRSPKGSGLKVSEGLLENRFVALKVTHTGALTLEDKATGERYPGLGLLEDEPDLGDTYTFSAARSAPRRGGQPIARSIAARGPLLGTLLTEWRPRSATRGRILVRQLVTLHADSPLVRVHLEIDNEARDHRLRARFPVGAGEQALAGAPFGAEPRAPVAEPTRGAAAERPALTAPAQRFVHAGRGPRGLAIFLPGTFEYEWTPRKELVLTLLRAVGELSRAGLKERPGHAAWPIPTPLAQEPGLHAIELALAPVGSGGAALAWQLQQLWEDAFLPLQSFYLREESPGR